MSEINNDGQHRSTPGPASSDTGQPTGRKGEVSNTGLNIVPPSRKDAAISSEKRGA